MIKSIRTIGMSVLAAGLGLLIAPAVAQAQDSVFVTATGNVGIGTSNPGARLEVSGGEVRFPSGSGLGGFTHFNFSGDGKNYIRGITVLADNGGSVGIGTTNPGAKLHLFDNADVFTVFRMENTSSGGNGVVSLHAASNSATAFLQAQGSGRTISHFGQAVASWAELLQVTGNGLIVGTLPNKPLILGTNNTNRLQIDGSTGAVTIAGDLIVNGTFSNPSSRELKENFAPLDPSMVLKKFAQLPINEWSYKSDEQRLRHVGPTVEDFRNAFGLGTEGQHIFPMDVQGVTMAAVQGLYQLVQEKDEQIAELQKELREIKQLLLEKGN